jgi:hypothetical protein
VVWCWRPCWPISKPSLAAEMDINRACEKKSDGHTFSKNFGHVAAMVARNHVHAGHVLSGPLTAP